MISTTLKTSSLDCASISGYLSAADGHKGNLIPSQSEIWIKHVLCFTVQGHYKGIQAPLNLKKWGSHSTDASLAYCCE